MSNRLKPTGKVVYHHIMTRTAQQVFWLQEPQVKDIFVDLLDFYSQIYAVDALAFCVMSNHYHICLKMTAPEFDKEDVRRRHKLAQSRLANPRVFQEELAGKYFKRYTDLSCFMWQINRGMSLAHNKLKKTKGHFWGARFKNVIVEPGESLNRVLAYIENNPTRAGIVEDPTQFPHSSVGRMKKQQDQGQTPKAPEIPLLASLPQEKRAQAYMDLMRYVALAITDPDLRQQRLPIQFTSIGIEIDMKAMCQALKTKAPSNWSNPVYGSESFAEETYRDAGWLNQIRRLKGAAQKGPSEAAS